jgi:hypothetical protein
MKKEVGSRVGSGSGAGSGSLVRGTKMSDPQHCSKDTIFLMCKNNHGPETLRFEQDHFWNVQIF